jgi:hypothetical protein
VQSIVRYLASQPGGGPLLPSGTRLTPRAFQLLGLSGLGSSGGLWFWFGLLLLGSGLSLPTNRQPTTNRPPTDPNATPKPPKGGFERLHYLLETFFDADREMSPFFARSFEGWMPWETNPIYALLHESIYCQVRYITDMCAARCRGG